MNEKTQVDRLVRNLLELFQDIENMSKECQNEFCTRICELEESIFVSYGSIVIGASINLCPKWKK